jgi:hypothetical protein
MCVWAAACVGWVAGASDLTALSRVLLNCKRTRVLTFDNLFPGAVASGSMHTVGGATSAAEHFNALFAGTDSARCRTAASAHLLFSASGKTQCV